jgi:aspartate/methionine/tyrosine aminotransferase
VEPGDRVISVLPTYQQHHSIPKAWARKCGPCGSRNRTASCPISTTCGGVVGGRAKLLAFSNPNNPTGSLMDRATLEGIVAIAREAGAWILSDEVYRGIDQAGDGFTASIADLYERGISTGSMSKVWSLAGLRLGWIAAPAELLRGVTTHRDYKHDQRGPARRLVRDHGARGPRRDPRAQPGDRAGQSRHARSVGRRRAGDPVREASGGTTALPPLHRYRFERRHSASALWRRLG